MVRSARNAGKVIRVLHVTEGWIGARAPQGEFVHVGFGEQDGALFEQHVGKRRIRLWAIVLEEWRSRRGGKAGRIDVVLDDDRQPGKRELRALRARAVDCAGVFGKLRLVDIGHRVQVGVGLLLIQQRLSRKRPLLGPKSRPLASQGRADKA